MQTAVNKGIDGVFDVCGPTVEFLNSPEEPDAVYDGRAIKNLQRVQSEVFVVALPANNVFDAPCIGAGLGDVPAGVYSPAVDDGFYVLLDSLPIGPHTLHFHAKNLRQKFEVDVTYNLTVVPVLLK
jgi:hypothetical protein